MSELLQTFQKLHAVNGSLTHFDISSTYDTDIEKLHAYYAGAHAFYMDKILTTAYPNAVKAGMRLTSIPVLKRIVDMTATLFHRPPIWELETATEEPLSPESPDVRIWGEIDDEMQLVSRLKIAQRGARRYQTVFAGPAWRSGRLVLDVLRPSLVYVVPNEYDPGNLDEAQAVFVKVGLWGADALHTTPAYMGWTKTTYTYIRQTPTGGWEESDPLETGGVNPYGAIPLVVIHDVPTDLLFAPVDESLISMQEQMNLLWTACDWQLQNGFVQNVLFTNDTKVDATVVVGGPDRLRVVNDPTGKYERVGSGLDLPGMIEYLGAKLKTYAALHAADPGIFSVDADTFANAISGIAKQIDRMDLTAIREDQERDMEYVLARLFNKIRAVNNYHKPDGQKLSSAVRLCVRWWQPETEQNALQAAQADEMRIEQKVKTPAEIKADKEGTTVAEAQAEIDRGE